MENRLNFNENTCPDVSHLLFECATQLVRQAFEAVNEVRSCRSSSQIETYDYGRARLVFLAD